MGLRINTNVASLGVQRRQFAITERLTQNVSRLSSGLRIARAADDAAGLGVSERMRAEVRSLAVAERNLLDGISLVQTADGSLGALHDLVGRIRELAVRSLNGTLASEDRETLTTEYDAITTEMGRLIDDAEFNGISLLSGFGSIDIQAGDDAAETISINTVSLSVYPQVFGSFDLNTESGADFAILIADIATDNISEVRGEFGASQNQLESALRSSQIAREGLAGAQSRIRDVDVASEIAQLVRNSILQELSISVLAQANVAPNIALSLLAGQESASRPVRDL